MDAQTKKNWNGLQRVCSSGIRVSLGALPSSPIMSLLVEAAEWPIKTRIQYLTDRLLIRWRSQQQHPALLKLQGIESNRRMRKYFDARPPLLLTRYRQIPPTPPNLPGTSLRGRAIRSPTSSGTANCLYSCSSRSAQSQRLLPHPMDGRRSTQPLEGEYGGTAIYCLPMDLAQR